MGKTYKDASTDKFQARRKRFEKQSAKKPNVTVKKFITIDPQISFYEQEQKSETDSQSEK